MTFAFLFVDLQGSIIAERKAQGRRELLVQWPADEHGETHRPEWVRETEISSEFPDAIRTWRKTKRRRIRAAREAAKNLAEHDMHARAYWRKTSSRSCIASSPQSPHSPLDGADPYNNSTVDVGTEADADGESPATTPTVTPTGTSRSKPTRSGSPNLRDTPLVTVSRSHLSRLRDMSIRLDAEQETDSAQQAEA
jgi:hypothetical protein